MDSPREIYPSTIFMQHDCDGDLSAWCADRVNDSDLVYVREEQLTKARADERARCAAIVEGYIYRDNGWDVGDIWHAIRTDG